MKGFRRRWSFLSITAACHGSDIDDNTKRSCDKKNYFGQNIMVIASTSSFSLTKGLTLQTSALKLFTVANLRYQLKFNSSTDTAAQFFLQKLTLIMAK